jgi:UDP-N-acetyl-D-mannosaminuronate dehydrogenase
VVGVAYKKDIDDLRESPALDIIRLLESQGADVSYHDPYVPEVTEDGQTHVSRPLTPETVDAADAVMIVTDHTNLDYRMLREHARVVVDTRHVLARVKRP